MWTCGLQVRVVDGAAKGRTYPLDAPVMKVGRANPGQVRTVGSVLINDDTVSRVQAELHWNDESQSFFLTNRSETNPTQVNNVVVQEVELQPGDQIRMGRCVLDLQKADFRFGGNPDIVPRARTTAAPPSARPAAASLAGAVQLPPSPPNLQHARRDLDQEPDIAVKVSRVSLTTRPPFVIEILAGEQRGQLVPIKGLTLALGGPLDPDAPPLEKGSQWFDQELVFSDCALPPRCLALGWKELSKVFELSRTVAAELDVAIQRHLDNMEWHAMLPAELPGLLRSGDIFQLGQNVMRVSTPAE